MPAERRSSSFSNSRAEGFISAREVVAGKIYWLPAKAAHDKLLDSTTENDGHFGHPVVALWANNQKKTVEVFVITSFGGRPLTSNIDRRLYLAIHPAENPHNINISLVLDDQLFMEKNCYVLTKTIHTLSWKMLKPYRDRQSGKHCKLKPESFAELLKHAKLSILTTIPKDLDFLPTTPNSTLFPPLSHRPLAPISANVRRPESHIERRAGSDLPTRPRTQPFKTYDSTLPGPAYPAALHQGATIWSAARPSQQHLRGHAYVPRTSYHEHSPLLSSSNEPDLEQGDPKPETTASSWYTVPRCIFAIFVVGICGYFTLFNR